MQINYTYKVDYSLPMKPFKFDKKNRFVDFTAYEERIMPNLDKVADMLNKDNSSRQAVIAVNDANCNTCLLNYQFQIAYNNLYATVNQRSQCSLCGQEHDVKLILYVISELKKKLKKSINFVDITFHIGNYHTREDLNVNDLLYEDD